MKNPAPVKGGAHLSRRNLQLIIAVYITDLMVSTPVTFELPVI